MGNRPSHGVRDEGSVSYEKRLNKIVSVNEHSEEDLKISADGPSPQRKEHRKLPHNYEVIMREADGVIPDGLHADVYSGVFLKQARKLYWVDKELGCNSFMIFAKELSITWSEDPQYWQWSSARERGVDVETAVLRNVCWLEVHGSFNTALLTPGSTYEAAFVVMVQEHAYGWETPVKLRLVGPEAEVQERSESLLDKPAGTWVELVAGSFTPATLGSAEDVQFSLFEYNGGRWKRGLVVKGLVIRPKKWM